MLYHGISRETGYRRFLFSQHQFHFSSLSLCVCVQAARLGAPLAPPLMATHPSLPPGPTPSMPMPALPVAAMPQPVETMPQPVSVVGKLLVKGKFDFKSVS